MVAFGTAGIRGSAVERVTPGVALAVGRALASITSDVVVGRDARTTSEGLAAAAAAGLMSGGADVTDVGVVPTAVVAAASQDRHGLMITASHNPPSDNGIKLFRDGVEFAREAERTIEQSVASGAKPAQWNEWGSRRRIDRLGEYRASVVSYLEGHGEAPDDLTVAVDCGHGMGGLATPQVLSELGADVRAVNATPDGHFPARDSKPTPRSLKGFRVFVQESPADIGIAHDGDADRVVILDGTGEIVHEDTILAILAHHYVDLATAGDPVVVTTPNASERVDDRVRAAGGRVERTRLGALHEGIAAAETTEGARVAFAGEPWKHIHPGFGGWIDGIVSAGLVVRLVAEAGSLDTLRTPIRERPYRKASLPCPDNRKDTAMAEIRDLLEHRYPEASMDTDYGVRLSWRDDSWVLVRPSGTEPKIRIYLEADNVDERLDAIREVVSTATDT